MPEELVLITGATGHLGFRILVELLQHGYRAGNAYHRPEQIDMIKAQRSIKPFRDSLEFVQVLDITAPDGYDSAIQGVDKVMHVASPMPNTFPSDDHDWQKLLYDPAEKGVLNVLTAASREPSVKRVVVTSSIVVLAPKDGSNRAGPSDVAVLPDAETMKNYPSAMAAYTPSKLLAHLATSKFVEEQKPHFDLIRILPGYTQGANELYTRVEDMRDFGKLGSNEGVMGTAVGRVTGQPRVTLQVLLDDVAKAHVLVLDPQHGKDRENLLLVGNGGNSTPWEEFVKTIKRLYPEGIRHGILTPKVEDPDIMADFDISSTEQTLGFKFAGAEEMVKSVVGQYLELVAAPR